MHNFFKIFSINYAKTSAIKNNPIQRAMYRATYPLALALNKFGISPNKITSASILFSIASAASLLIYESPLLFSILWLTSLSLDLCDGVVARMSNRVSTTAFRYDHYSDLFKYFIVATAAIAKYNSVWASVTIGGSIFFFMFYSLLHLDISSRKSIEKKDQVESHEYENTLSIESLKTVALSINGHTYLYIALIGIGEKTSIAVFLYICLVSMMRSALLIRTLINMPRKAKS